MEPVNFEQVNRRYVKDGCDDLPVYECYNDQYNTKECISCFELTDEEIEIVKRQIEEGKRPAVYLSVLGGQPPVGLWIRND